MFTIPTEFSACVPYMQQIMWLYNAVQELSTGIQELNSDIDDLEERIEALENQINT